MQLNLKAVVGNNMAIEFVTGTTDEARSFLNWVDSLGAAKEAAIAAKPAEAPAQAEVEEEPAEAVTRDMCAKRAIELVNTKGRDAFNAVIGKFGAKRVGEVPEEKLAALYAALGE